jgi:hypothetical protein
MTYYVTQSFDKIFRHLLNSSELLALIRGDVPESSVKLIHNGPLIGTEDRVFDTRRRRVAFKVRSVR